MPLNRTRRYYPPKAPTVDGARVRADAAMYLANVRDITTVSTEKLTRCYRLRPNTAAKMLAEEVTRRAAVDCAR